MKGIRVLPSGSNIEDGEDAMGMEFESEELVPLWKRITKS